MIVNKNDKKEKNEMPMGLGFGLAMNERAMSNFSSMEENEKKQVIEAARNVQSKAQMQHLVQDIADMDEKKEYDFLGKAASAMDCTGLIFHTTEDKGELKNYEKVYDFLPPGGAVKEKED